MGERENTQIEILSKKSTALLRLTQEKEQSEINSSFSQVLTEIALRLSSMFCLALSSSQDSTML